MAQRDAVFNYIKKNFKAVDRSFDYSYVHARTLESCHIGIYLVEDIMNDVVSEDWEIERGEVNVDRVTYYYIINKKYGSKFKGI